MNMPDLPDKTLNTGVGARCKNPGNRTGTDSTYGSGVDTSSAHKWTIYKDWEHGYAGNCSLLLKYLDGTKKSQYGLGERNPCMASVIFTWCPPSGVGSESLEKTKKYVKTICDYLEIESDDRIAITENNLVCIEIAKGSIDSGCVHKDACKKGVKMCVENYIKNGGHLDTNENLGKVDSQIVKDITSGISVGGSSSGGNSGGTSNSSSSSTSNTLGVDGSKYTNGTGTFSGTEWGKPVEGDVKDLYKLNSSKNGKGDGVIVGTHMRQKYK